MRGHAALPGAAWAFECVPSATQSSRPPATSGSKGAERTTCRHSRPHTQTPPPARHARIALRGSACQPTARSCMAALARVRVCCPSASVRASVRQSVRQSAPSVPSELVVLSKAAAPSGLSLVLASVRPSVSPLPACQCVRPSPRRFWSVCLRVCASGPACPPPPTSGSPICRQPAVAAPCRIPAAAAARCARHLVRV